MTSNLIRKIQGAIAFHLNKIKYLENEHLDYRFDGAHVVYVTTEEKSLPKELL